MSKTVNCNFFSKMYSSLEKDTHSCLTHQRAATNLTQQEGINMPLLGIEETYCRLKARDNVFVGFSFKIYYFIFHRHLFTIFTSEYISTLNFLYFWLAHNRILQYIQQLFLMLSFAMTPILLQHFERVIIRNFPSLYFLHLYFPSRHVI